MSELADLTAQCIRCGFCLESCPTFVISGDETESPRGRIYLVRSLLEGKVLTDESVQRSLDTCVGCRACETACPSGVRYGEILEQARATYRPRKELKLLLSLMTRPNLFRTALQAAHLVGLTEIPRYFTRGVLPNGAQVRVPHLPDSAWEPPSDPLPPIRGTVDVLEGCVMPVLFPEVNRATESLLRRVGFQTRWRKGCCGALHAHNSFVEEGRRMARRWPDSSSILTNSAGCGSHLLDQQVGATDVGTFLYDQGLLDLVKESPGLSGQSATYLPACHLRHGMKSGIKAEALLQAIPRLSLKPLDGSSLCCGSGGIYQMMQPTRAKKLQQIKAQEVVATGAQLLVTGNPGCHQWMAQAFEETGRSVQVLHTLTLLESSFSGSLPHTMGKNQSAL